MGTIRRLSIFDLSTLYGREKIITSPQNYFVDFSFFDLTYPFLVIRLEPSLSQVLLGRYRLKFFRRKKLIFKNTSSTYWNAFPHFRGSILKPQTCMCTKLPILLKNNHLYPEVYCLQKKKLSKEFFFKAIPKIKEIMFFLEKLQKKSDYSVPNALKFSKLSSASHGAKRIFELLDDMMQSQTIGSRYHYIEMEQELLPEREGSVARNGKNFPIWQPPMATILRFSPIFRAPFRKYMPNQEVEIGKDTW